MKDQENGILSTIFYKTIGRFAPQSNENETRIELSPFIDKYIGILFDGNEGSNVTVYCHQNRKYIVYICLNFLIVKANGFKIMS